MLTVLLIKLESLNVFRFKIYDYIICMSMYVYYDFTYTLKEYYTNIFLYFTILVTIQTNVIKKNLK